MDIWSEPGCKVRYAKPESGYPNDVELGKEHLELNSIYVVDKIKVNNWSTNVTLRGFPDVSFNSCLFENVDPVDPEKAKINEQNWIKGRKLR